MHATSPSSPELDEIEPYRFRPYSVLHKASEEKGQRLSFITTLEPSAATDLGHQMDERAEEKAKSVGQRERAESRRKEVMGSGDVPLLRLSQVKRAEKSHREKRGTPECRRALTPMRER
ncbi:uncharacterized protein MONOS_14427 [Monocercomonoides exilis]|uniref:uncharacterized protein n=1 Tax=Monocercomonoides exilis TaxID=2049356 RepID=UPI00355A317F|nr:hypothetical protein MONOS_14427 [Monocercomonoides exilis]|eukprot:MONOS_14427.1-p1 / transcript=MONOS_14427.1 / gene=MONOS_14427 / organism=Monocercomonoides_exilis_PA203 / gene_product=unspecified product / transcript_product=unspecified product / location=Mono_scaffold00999:8246-8669(+) / protein_length=119 / sequence_SO=supercontig / SO=protein_coding / is_pseudo=false